ncbi:hypothetical protein WH50_25225 [Pokkaliibacter plantistimulans]|uniref:UbiC transcription regulator-associated domain-containing protein n=1 Tax=Pokkaliibacter plantistimulans TaxID=1635171 RepID=A0ABX5LR08_9GAMM|nr:hypothetical protein [Pokkaliibacter plantistimulans]PXF28637.1 hypothetical protein WH50_25225 [Pokkaliibacter plantistimulans]
MNAGALTQSTKVITTLQSSATAKPSEEGKPVAVIERVALGYDRQPIEYRLSRGAADTFRYQIDIF